MGRVEQRGFTSVEICAGAGGQALGLHNAGFRHHALVELDDHAVATLQKNVGSHHEWKGCSIIKEDLNKFDPCVLGLDEGSLDLLAGGVPCPPFSSAGKQLGENDDRDLFPEMLRLVKKLQPKAVMIENVRGLLQPEHKFLDYRTRFIKDLERAGYDFCGWEVIEACHYGVPQLRPRAILVAMKPEFSGYFTWPEPRKDDLVTVGTALAASMRARFGQTPQGKAAFKRWYELAENDIAPTLVGGSKKHGGADLGPTRAKRAWLKLGVDAMGVANEPEEMKDPDRDLYAVGAEGEPLGPKLTVTQAAIIQGFPAHWEFAGRKTAAYRQVGNAFPPPVAQAVGERIADALKAGLEVLPKGTRSAGEEEEDSLFPLPAVSLPATRSEFTDSVSNLQGASTR
ncbi:DNA cytosine methyltransferase [Streptomyces sp. NBC_01775]|uniref:DNA cytosine methyltransferase n=1 Tax=Streptomyces sp. NBC_01775 TaxID=2975939 RepID=UPI002DDA7FDA|nr:DNA (cytosine-5-)-methyltransferase [Streptomyces sp. NBC_01775]WSB78189.1 DNA cytosine methyltransferase [Streptomyces sp. NBC_01775]